MNPSQPPPAEAPTAVVQYWLRRQCLNNDAFAGNAVRDIVLKFKNDTDELQNFLSAIRDKNSDSACSFVNIKEISKRIEVQKDGKRCRIFAAELVYKLYRHIGATKKKMLQHCRQVDGDSVCINPYHYQFVENGENVPDELSNAARNARDLVLYFPVVDVNELPDKSEVGGEKESEEQEEVEKDEEVDEEDFFCGAARALSSTVVVPKCQSCEKLKIILSEKDKRIAELEKQLKDRDQSEARRIQPSRLTKKK